MHVSGLRGGQGGVKRGVVRMFGKPYGCRMRHVRYAPTRVRAWTRYTARRVGGSGGANYARNAHAGLQPEAADRTRARIRGMVGPIVRQCPPALLPSVASIDPDDRPADPARSSAGPPSSRIDLRRAQLDVGGEASAEDPLRCPVTTQGVDVLDRLGPSWTASSAVTASARVIAPSRGLRRRRPRRARSCMSQNERGDLGPGDSGDDHPLE